MWCWGVIGRVVHGVSVNLVSLSHHILPHYTVLTTTSLVSNVLVHVKNISVSWVGLALDAQPSQRESMQQEICGWYCRPGIVLPILRSILHIIKYSIFETPCKKEL